MNDCYEGVAVPTPIEEPCGNVYISTDCVTSPNQFLYLDLPAGSSQTAINTNLVLALQTANGLIQDLLARVEMLENT